MPTPHHHKNIVWIYAPVEIPHIETEALVILALGNMKMLAICSFRPN